MHEPSGPAMQKANTADERCAPPSTVLVLGGTGQIGRCMLAEIKQHWPAAQLLSPTRAELDLSNAAAVLAYLQQHQPDWLINCAAFTAVDLAEQDLLFSVDTHPNFSVNFSVDTQWSVLQWSVDGQQWSVDIHPSNMLNAGAVSMDAHPNTLLNAANVSMDTHPNTLLNAVLPMVLADYWQASLKPLTVLHYSSDYVYSGQGDMPWREDDALAPTNAYGRAKAVGDQALLSSLRNNSQTAAATASRLYILRTCWVYHQQGQNFINTMLRLAEERDVLHVVDDQFGAPTPAQWAAQVSGLLLRSQAASGVYHLAPSGVTSWYGVAHAALSSAVSVGLISQVPELIAIESHDYLTPAKRPHNSRLDCQKLKQALGIEFPEWQRLLREHMSCRSR